MTNTNTRLTVLLDEELKRAFDAACSQEGLTASEVLRRLIQQFVDTTEPSDDAAPRRSD